MNLFAMIQPTASIPAPTYQAFSIAAAKLPGPSGPVRSVAPATIEPMIAMPIAEPKLRKVWVTPEPWPRRLSGRRLRASVFSGEKTSPKPAPVISIPQEGGALAQFREVAAPDDHADAAEDEADTHRFLRPAPRR